MRAQSFETVFNPMRGSTYFAVTALPSTLALESMGMAISLEAFMILRVAHERENVPHIFGAKSTAPYSTTFI